MRARGFVIAKMPPPVLLSAIEGCSPPDEATTAAGEKAARLMIRLLAAEIGDDAVVPPSLPQLWPFLGWLAFPSPADDAAFSSAAAAPPSLVLVFREALTPAAAKRSAALAASLLPLNML